VARVCGFFVEIPITRTMMVASTTAAINQVHGCFKMGGLGLFAARPAASSPDCCPDTAGTDVELVPEASAGATPDSANAAVAAATVAVANEAARGRAGPCLCALGAGLTESGGAAETVCWVPAG
jgi:hypothetical protein